MTKPYLVHKSGLLLFCLLPMLSSCMRGDKYISLMQELPTVGWDRLHGLIFDLPLHDSLSYYHIDLTGRLRNTYHYDSLSIILQVSAPDGASFCDTVSLGLIHANDRIWEDFRFGYCSKVTFSQKGIWRFELRHNMDRDLLKGISAIGVSIQKETNGKK